MGEFDQFPKIRFPLPEAYQRIYASEYLANRRGKNLANKLACSLEGWMHQRVAASASRKKEEDILEIGAGTLNHLPWESRFRSYDVVEPTSFLLESSDRISLVRNIYPSIKQVDASHRYDRIISIAALEHMEDLPTELARSALLLKEDGLFCAGVPSEGSFIWYLAWKFGTGLPFRFRTGLDYSIIMKYEHINNLAEIEEATRWFFKEVEIARFPLSCVHLSLYSVILARDVHRDRCIEQLGKR